MALKCERTTEDTANLYSGPPAPLGIPAARWQRTGVGPTVAWYRGRHAGQVDVILTLQEMGHTRIAEKLQKHYHFNDDGSVGGS